MKVVIRSDFTARIEMFIDYDGTGDKVEKFIMNGMKTSSLQLMSMINSSEGSENLQEIVFIGNHKVFKQLEKRFKKDDKEVTFTWLQN